MAMLQKILPMIHVVLCCYLVLAINLKPYAQELIQQYTHESGNILCAALSPDGKTAVTGSDGDGRSIQIWNAETGESQFQLNMPWAIRSVEFSKDGNSIVVISGGDVSNDISSFAVLIEAATGREIWRFEYSDRFDTAGCFMPDGKNVLTAVVRQRAGTLYYQTEFRIWNIDERTVVSELGSIQNQVVSNLRISPTGFDVLMDVHTIYPIRQTFFISLFDLRQLQSRAEFLYPVALSPDGRTLASNEIPRIIGPQPSEAVYILNVDNFSIIRSLGTKPEYPKTFTPDGRYLITQLDSTQIWNVSSGESIATFQNPIPVTYLSLSGDGTRLICGYVLSPSVYVWDISGLLPSTIIEDEWKEYDPDQIIHHSLY